MQAHETSQAPKFDPSKPDGVKPQADDDLMGVTVDDMLAQPLSCNHGVSSYPVITKGTP